MTSLRSVKNIKNILSCMDVNTYLESFCEICYKKVNKTNMDEFSFCAKCPNKDGIVLYCGDHKSIARIRHSGIDHDVEFKLLTNVKSTGQAKLMKSKYNEMSLQSQNEIVRKVHTISQNTTKVIALASKGIGYVIRYESALTAVGTKLAIKLGSETSKKILKNVLHGAKAIQIGILIGEVGLSTAKFLCGKITAKEWVKQTGRAVATNVTSFAGTYAGLKAGAFIGGFAGPLGMTIGGIIGAILGGIIGSVGSSYFYDKYFPSDDEKARKEALEKALLWFNITVDQAKDPNLFTENFIRKIYREKAKKCHPDRGGSIEQFIILGQHFAVLLAAVDGRQKKNPVAEKTLKSITL